MHARLLISLCLLLSSPLFSAAATSPDSFTGFLTAVLGPNRFSVGPQQVTWNPKTTRIYAIEQGKEVDDSADMTMRVGAYLRVEGKISKTGEFVASSIGFLAPEVKTGDKISGIGLVEEKPQFIQNGAGVTGTLWVEGYALHVTPQTKLLSAEGKVFPTSEIGPNLWAEFDATRSKDNSIEANSITFEPNTVSVDEVKYRDKSEPEIEQPDYAKHKPGKIKYRHRWTLSILPDEAVQQYVTRVGESLIPQYQKELPTSDPTKINFQFYVVERPSKWKEVLTDASASAGGVIIIPDNVLAMLDNESQLAALLSNCIAVTLEKQLFVHRLRMKVQKDIALASMGAEVYGPSSYFGLPVGIGNSVVAGRLMLRINEQAGRIGLRYMLREGYDIREAPFAWTVAANRDANNPERHILGPPALVECLMGDLYFDYAAVDYSHLKTGREAYRSIIAKLRAERKLPKSRNYPGD